MTSIIRAPSLSGSPRSLDLGRQGAGTATRVSKAGGASAPVPPISPTVALRAQSAADDEYTLHRQDAKTEGFALGCAQGREEGIKTGYSEGFEAGVVEGRKAGHEQGYKQGLAEGLLQGEKDAESAMSAHLARLGELLQSIDLACASLESIVEDDAVEAVFAALVQIVGVVNADRSALSAAYAAALQRVRDRRRLVLHLHPEDLAFVQGLGEGEMTAALSSSLECVADATIDCGGCRIVSSGGELDARLDRQLAALRGVLLAARAQRNRIDP